jgi:hypothetical protein
MKSFNLEENGTEITVVEIRGLSTGYGFEAIAEYSATGDARTHDYFAFAHARA